MKLPRPLSLDARFASASWAMGMMVGLLPAVGVPQRTRGAAARLAVSA